MGQENYSVFDVFTPATPARLCFVERDDLNDQLVNPLRTPGKQIVVYGHSGSGKTTLLVNKLQQLYESHISTHCMKSMTYEQLVLDAFDQLAPYYLKDSSVGEGASISGSLESDFKLIKATLSSELKANQGEHWERGLPMQLTPQTLARFMGEARACWVLEDFHKMPAAEKQKVSQLMKVFMDLSDSYPTLKIIALGAVGTAREVIEYDSEMRNRVAEIHVPLMTEGELRRLLVMGEELLRIRLGGNVVNSMAHYANGLPAVAHQLALHMCTESGVLQTQIVDRELPGTALDSALKLYLQEASDTLKAVFDRALRPRKKTRYDNPRLILRALTELPEEGAGRADIYRKVIEYEPGYPQSNCSVALSALQTEDKGQMLRFDQASGKFSFSDPIYRAMAMVMFDADAQRGLVGGVPVVSTSTLDELMGALRVRIGDALKAYSVTFHVNEPSEE
ncbi:MAG: AAA family ATPase [Dehalococcoidia bacterium]